jgi:hypothetical protein
MLAVIIFEKWYFAGGTLRNHVIRACHCLLQLYDLLLSVIKFAPVYVMSGAPLPLTQSTELKPAVLTAHWRLLLQHHRVCSMSGVAVGTIHQLVLSLYQLHTVLVENMCFHYLLQDISVYWLLALHTPDLISDDSISVGLSLVS